MQGYWKNDKATEETIDKDGWLHTGDVAYYDHDEYFFVIDRTKELIKVKGNQVSFLITRTCTLACKIASRISFLRVSSRC